MVAEISKVGGILMVITTADMARTAVEKSVTITNKQKVVVEAGELKVPKNDAVIPTKLRLLGEAGWSVVDVIKEDDGFSLLMVRYE